MFRTQIDAIEKRLADAGSNVSRLCDVAGIARSTWTRWKTGETMPNMATWKVVEAAVAEIVSKSRETPEGDAA